MIRVFHYILIVSVLLFSQDSFSQKKKKNKKSKKEVKGERNLEFQFYFHDAIREKMIGNYMSSITLFKKCIELEPKDDATHYAISELYANIGQLNESFHHAQQSVSLSPKNQFYKLNFALISLQTGKYKEAVEVYQDLLKSEPENLEYLFQYSECLVYLNEIDELLEVYAKIEEQVGVYKELSLRKHEIYRQQKKSDLAIRELEKLIESSPGNPEYYQYLIDYYNSIKEEKKAFETLELMIAKNPDNGYAQIKLSEYYMNQNQLDKALNAIRNAFSGKTVDIDTKVKLLITLYDISENNEELTLTGYQLLDSLVKYHPEESKSYSIKGDFLLRDNRNSESRKAFKKASELDDSKFAIWRQLLILDDELKKWEEMYEDAYLASENFPSQPMFYLFQGKAGIQIGKYREASEILDFGKGIVLNDKALTLEFNLLLAEALYRNEEVKRAFDIYEEIIKNEPENDLVLNNYAYYLALENQNLDRALELSEKANQLVENNSSYEDTYAYILFRKGEYEKALNWSLKAKKNASYESGTLNEHLGDIYIMLNNTEKALEFWKKAKEFEDHTQVLDKKIMDKKFYEAE